MDAQLEARADKVSWTRKLKALLGMVSAEMQGRVDQTLISKQAMANRGITDQSMKDLLHFSSPAPGLKGRRLETRAMLTMLVASGLSVTDAASVKAALYGQKNADLVVLRGQLDALLKGGAGAPAAATAILGDKSNPLGKLLMTNKAVLGQIVAAMPDDGATVTALESVESALVQDPKQFDADATPLTVDAHEVFYKKKTEAHEHAIESKLAASNNPKLAALKKLPRDEYWKILIDGKVHNKHKHFYDRSKGFMGSMMKGLHKIVDEIDTPLSADFVQELHQCATQNVTSETRVDPRMPLMTNNYQETGLKKTPNSWGVCKDYTADGMRELKTIREDLDKQVQGGYFAEDEMRFKGDPKTVVQWRAGKSEVGLDDTVEKLMKHVIAKCYTQLGSAGDADAKLDAIIDCCRSLGVIHPFKDANGRLIMFMVLNKLLMEQGFPPTILQDQGAMVGKSRKELRALIRAGQGKVQQLQA